jgi:hypothetical protein
VSVHLQFAPLRRMGPEERAAPEPCSWFRRIGPVPPALTAVGVPLDLVLGWGMDLAAVGVPPYLAVLLGLSGDWFFSTSLSGRRDSDFLPWEERGVFDVRNLGWFFHVRTPPVVSN